MEILDDTQNTTSKVVVKQNLLGIGNVYSGKEKIVQVTTNMVTNAIKYSPNSNKIINHTSIKKGNYFLNRRFRSRYSKGKFNESI